MGIEEFRINKIVSTYLRGTFLIDLISTIPVDTTVFVFTGVKYAILSTFSLLKLIRMTKIPRIISRINVTENTKMGLKLCLLIFYILLYIHCLACFWFMVIKQRTIWLPPYFTDWGDKDMYRAEMIWK